jgi:hypothetical protein
MVGIEKYRNNQRHRVFYAELKHESIYKSSGGSRVIYYKTQEGVD